VEAAEGKSWREFGELYRDNLTGVSISSNWTCDERRRELLNISA